MNKIYQGVEAYPAISDGWRYQQTMLKNEDMEARKILNEAVILARHVQQHHPAYKNIYSNLEITRFDKLPLIDKKVVCDHIDSFLLYCGVKLDQIELYFQSFGLEKTLGCYLAFHSSGSSGRQSITLYNQFEFGRSLYSLFHKIVEAQYTSKMSYIGLVDRYNGGNQWMFHLASNMELQLLNYFDDTELNVGALLTFQPEIIFTKPTKLKDIGRYLVSHGEKLLALKSIISVGEDMSEDDANEIEELLVVKPQNSFSTTETGPIAFQSNANLRQLELYQGLSHVEIVDRQGEAISCADESGRLVVSSIYNRSFPLLRYDLADHVHWIKGKVGLAISFMQGRGEKVLTFRHFGITGSINELPLWRYQHKQISAAQFEQIDQSTLLVRIELKSKQHHSKDILQMIQQDIKHYLQQHGLCVEINLSVQIVEKILPDLSTSKVKRVICS